MEKNTGKVREKSGNFVNPEKWEPWLKYGLRTHLITIAIRNRVINWRCEWTLMLHSRQSRCAEIHTQKCRWLCCFCITLQNIWHHITAHTHGLSVCFIYLVNQHHIPAYWEKQGSVTRHTDTGQTTYSTCHSTCHSTV